MNALIAKQTDKELGEIFFKRNLRSKRMSIKILSGRLEVNLPQGFTENEGMRFVNSVREKLLKRQKSAAEKSILLTENNPLQTLTCVVYVKKVQRKDLFSSLKSGVLTIEYPEELDENDIRTQQLAEKYHFSFSEVKIQSSKTRWGSCNLKRTINLSFYLLLLPQHLVDYVILHELCHTKEMNHSPRFWGWMDKVTDGKAKRLRAELKGYAIPH